MNFKRGFIKLLQAEGIFYLIVLCVAIIVAIVNAFM